MQHGNITEFIFDPRKRVVFVSYSNIEEAIRAQSRLNNCKIMDSTLEVVFPPTKVPVSKESAATTDNAYSVQWNLPKNTDNNRSESIEGKNSTLALNNSGRDVNSSGSNIYPGTTEQMWSYTDTKPAMTAEKTQLFTPSSFLQGNRFQDQRYH